MSKTKADEAINKMIALARRLNGLDRGAPTYGEERKAVLDAVRMVDAEATAAFAAYADAETADAAAMRAAAEASIDGATRAADELERSRLVASGTNADVFAGQAAAMLAAGQPARAKLLAAVARDKGARIDPTFDIAVEDALDATDTKRKAAKATETAIESAADDFYLNRMRLLALTTGVTREGLPGDGSIEERTSASASAKLAAFSVAQKRGEEYHPKPEDLATGEVIPKGYYESLDAARDRQRRERASALAADPSVS